MRQQLISLIILLVLNSAVWLVQNTWLQNPTTGVAFLFRFLFWTTGGLAAILGLHLVLTRTSDSQDGRHEGALPFWANRRESFRMIYPDAHRPLLVVERVDRQPRRHLEYAVADLSEGGFCFIDDGSLGPGDHLVGRLLFRQGDQVRVVGTIVRREGGRISVALDRALAWRKVLDEQRRLLSNADQS